MTICEPATSLATLKSSRLLCGVSLNAVAEVIRWDDEGFQRPEGIREIAAVEAGNVTGLNPDFERSLLRWLGACEALLRWDGRLEALSDA